MPRPVLLAAVVALLLAAVPAAPARAATADLVRELDGLVSGFHGGAGIWVADPSVQDPLWAHAADERIITASLYKLGVLAEAERRVETGELKYRDTVTIETEDVLIDGSFEPVGTELTIDEALEAMITISDNGSARALWHVLGGSNIDATLQKAGMPDFHIAVDEFEDNWATPRAVGTFFTLLAKRQLISPAASDRMLARLERQQINNRLPAQLPPGVVVAHKTGNLPGLAHDAGIIFTKSGPRVVVAMTWDAGDDDADAFIASLGALVYSAILEPAANARFGVARQPLVVDAGTEQRVTIPITNIGTRAWAPSGNGSVGVIWELRGRDGQLMRSAQRAQVLPPLGPQQTQNVGIDLLVPAQPGTYTVTVSLTDSSGTSLAAQGAATAKFTLRAHKPYLLTAQPQVPIVMHQGEASLLITPYAALGGLSGDHPLSLSWRVVDPRNGRTVRQGASAVGTLQAGASGTFISSLIAPDVLGTYRFSYELSEGGVATSETFSKLVEVSGPRTYGGDEGRSIPTGDAAPAPSSSPRFRFPPVPRPSLPVQLPLPKGKAPVAP